MGQGQRKYEKEYKVQAVKLTKEIGAKKAAQELGIPVDTLCRWQKAVREGRLDADPGSHALETAMSLAEELAALRKQVKELEKANRRLKEENEFLAEAMRAIHKEDPCNDTYGRRRMRQALLMARPEGVRIPSEGTVRRVMEQIGLVHRPKHRPNGFTKADRAARKSNDLLKRDFRSDKPLEKCVTDITEIKAKDGKLYVSAMFDCFNLTVLGLVMDTNMRAQLCVRTLCGAAVAYLALRGTVVHSDRGSQYTSGVYRAAAQQYGIHQSMNSNGGRCHDNARCESMWARVKSELFYDRLNPECLTVEGIGYSVKSCVSENRQSQGWRWGNRANRGLKPFLTTRLGRRGGMRAAGGVNTALAAGTR